MYVIHKPGDWRCTVHNFECPNCGRCFTSPIDLQNHMQLNHTQLSGLSLVSEAGSEIEKLLLESNDSFESPVFVVNKRIQQNLNVEDLENDSDN